MSRLVVGTIIWIAVLASTMSCAPPGADLASSRGATGDWSEGQPKRIVAVIRGVPVSLGPPAAIRDSGQPGLDAVAELVHASLVHADHRGELHPQLAEAVPTLENGLWQHFPDGRMATTLTIKPTARWHDGTVVTTDDLLLATRVDQDRELGMPRARVWDYVEAIEPRDARNTDCPLERAVYRGGRNVQLPVRLPVAQAPAGGGVR